MSDAKSDDATIRYAPTDGLTYNPNEPKYWDREAMEKEILRTFDLCHGCRMCFKFCQSFPTLFDAVDAADGNVRKVTKETRDTVVDQCFQCKLCYTQCPYTEAEGHEFKLDFPRLMLRAKAIERKETGVPLRDRMLADPDRIGRMATKTPALANWANRFRPHRILMEMFAGIHRDKLLPPFESPTFDAWVTRETNGRREIDGDHPVVLFSTCFVNWNRPAVGKAALAVLEHNRCKIACPELNCCGMPALDQGDIPLAQRQATANVRTLLPFVERGFKIAVVNPTCSLMIRQEYPELLDDPADPVLAEAARQVAAATRDVSEFLNDLRKEGKFLEDFKSAPGGDVAYHAPCHLRMQNVGFRGRDLMRRIPDVKPKLVAECCGHDGTWALKKENYEAALHNGRKAFEGMNDAAAEVWSTDCPLAAVQFEQACGRKALHPLEILERAYREDGFERRLEPTEGER